MQRKELIDRVTTRLVELGKTKPTRATRNVFYISDQDGNQSEFVIKKKGRNLQYTQGDVAAMFDAMISVIEDAMRRGEDVDIRGFGRLYPHRRAARSSIHPKTKKRVPVPETYVPKFSFYGKLDACAKLYGKSLSDPTGIEDIDNPDLLIDDEELEEYDGI